MVADAGWSVFYDVWGGGYTPAQALIAPGMRLVKTSAPSAAEIEAVLPQ